jgi:hypothetical protein
MARTSTVRARSEILPPLPDLEDPKSIPDAIVEILGLSTTRQEAAYAIGQRFIWLKKQVREQGGNWIEWVEQNVARFSERTARRYMAFARMCVKARGILPRKAGDDPSDNDEWYTPDLILNPAREVLGGFDLDPSSCAKANARVKAVEYYSLEKGQDGLLLPWKGKLWMNPPYCSKTGDFVTRMLREYSDRNVTAAIMLLNSYHIALPWFKPVWQEGVLCFTLDKLPFLGPDGKERFTLAGNVLVYLGHDEDRFIEVFSKAGPEGFSLGHFVETPTIYIPPDMVPRLRRAAAAAGCSLKEIWDRFMKDLYEDLGK